MPEELWPILDRLNDLMARLESGFERERRFSANLAHELRTPVTELKTAAEVALRWPDQAPEQVFRDVLDISGQMQTIVESLLILARPGRLVPEEPGATVSLAALAADCWRPYARRAEEKGLHVEFAADLDRSLTSHAGLLRLILSNLFSNAVEYTPSGGRICVASRAASAGRLDLAAGNSVGGFDPADLPHLFERFWRRDPARTGGRHHGLGLCVAKACAEALACDLTADFDPANAWLEFRLRSREGRPPADAERNFTT